MPYKLKNCYVKGAGLASVAMPQWAKGLSQTVANGKMPGRPK